MNSVVRIFLFLVLGTFWTYAVPSMRIETPIGTIPYAVPLVGLLLIVEFALKPFVLVARDVPINIAICIYLIGTTIAASKGYAPPSLVFKAIAFPLGMFAVARSIESSRDSGYSLIVLCASTFVILAYGAYGYTTWQTGDRREHEYGYFAVTYMPSTRNGDQMYFLTGSAILLAVLFEGLRTSRISTRKFTSYAGYLAFTGAIILSFCRGAWITAAVVAVCLYSVCANIQSKKRLRNLRNVLIAVVLLGATVAFALSLSGSEKVTELEERLSSVFTLEERQGGNSNAYRLDLIDQALGLVAENPMGIGLGAASINLVVDGQDFGNHAENGYIQILLELGPLSFFAFIFILIVSLVRSYRLARRPDANWIDFAMFGLHLTLSSYQMFNNLIDSAWFWICFGLILGHTEAMHLKAKPIPGESLGSPRPVRT